MDKVHRNRRKFRPNIAGGATGVWLVGAGALAIPESFKTDVNENGSVSYRVEGFSCVTCAWGLEVMLRAQKGVATQRDGRDRL